MATGDRDVASGKAQPAAPPAPSLHVPPLTANSIPQTSAAISTASREATALANDTLEQEASRNRHTRREAIRSTVHWMKVVFLIFLTLLLIVSMGIVAFHMMTPYRFLSDTQLDTLKTILGSSVVTGLATAMGKNVVRDLDT